MTASISSELVSWGATFLAIQGKMRQVSLPKAANYIFYLQNFQQ
jgi:hypothetical protein